MLTLTLTLTPGSTRIHSALGQTLTSSLPVLRCGWHVLPASSLCLFVTVLLHVCCSLPGLLRNPSTCHSWPILVSCSYMCTRVTWPNKRSCYYYYGASQYYTVSQKVPTFKLSVTLSNLNRFSFFALLESVCNLPQSPHDITHLTLRMLLHGWTDRDAGWAQGIMC